MKSRDMADYADTFAAIGAESRLQILCLLLGAHPDGMVVGDILACRSPKMRPQASRYAAMRS
jgi:hypothetical protein